MLNGETDANPSFFLSNDKYPIPAGSLDITREPGVKITSTMNTVLSRPKRWSEHFNFLYLIQIDPLRSKRKVVMVKQYVFLCYSDKFIVIFHFDLFLYFYSYRAIGNLNRYGNFSS